MEEAAQFLGDAQVVRLDQVEVGGVVAAWGAVDLAQPVGVATVAALAMGSRTEPHHEGQVEFGTGFHEAAEVEAAVEAQGAALDLVLVPELRLGEVGSSWVGLGSAPPSRCIHN
ncbi:hypothetical protein GCM10009654_19200 [Streptomyces hebeiensis]|uniref:Uncharacterized protein n=1 Tax=Streptomyces hebeiensis TaxID=229486 RepID=A0ABP4FCG1_9ACTN